MDVARRVRWSFDETVMRRLAESGCTLPAPARPRGHYEATRCVDSWLFVSGQFPMRDGIAIHAGRVGGELTIDEGRAAARQAALNVLAQIRAALGSFDHLEGLARIEGHVAAAPGFTDAPAVLDGASELFAAALGDRGRHARTAFIHPALPLGMTIELVATAKVRVGKWVPGRSFRRLRRAPSAKICI